MATESLRRLLLAVALAWLAQGAARADAVADPPASWRARVLPIAAHDVSALADHEREALAAVRARIGGALAAGQPDAAALAEAYAELGALYRVHGAAAPADDAFENARRLAPGVFRWAYFGAVLAQETGRVDTALARLEAARALDPDYAPLALRVAQLRLDQGALAEAAAGFAAAAADPGLAAAAELGLGKVRLIERDPAAAEAHLARALTLDPEASAVHYPLARALRAQGRDAEARAHLDRRGTRQPRFDDPVAAELERFRDPAATAFGRGMQAVHARDYGAALRAFEQGVALAPDNLNARVTLARLGYLDGQPERARALLADVLDSDPGHGLARFLAALLDDAGGRAAAAETGYRAVLAAEPGHAGARYYLGLLLLRSARPALAAAELAAAAAAEPDNAFAQVLRQAALAAADAPDAERLAALREARDRHPDHPLLGYFEARLRATSTDPAVRDPARALAFAREIARPPGAPPGSVELLALAQAAAGDFDAAAETLKPLAELARVAAPPAEARRLEAAHRAYAAARLPADAARDPVAAALLAVPAPDPTGPMRDYGAAKPY